MSEEFSDYEKAVVAAGEELRKVYARYYAAFGAKHSNAIDLLEGFHNWMLNMHYVDRGKSDPLRQAGHYTVTEANTAMESMRAAGYAVTAFSPEEMAETWLSSRELEDCLAEHGNLTIANNPAKEYGA